MKMYVKHVLLVPGVTLDCVPGVTNSYSSVFGELGFIFLVAFHMPM